MTAESTNPYEAACDAYDAHMEGKGWSDEDLPGLRASHHSEAIGAAVDAAVKAERARLLEAFTLLAGTFRSAGDAAAEDRDEAAAGAYHGDARDTLAFIARFRSGT